MVPALPIIPIAPFLPTQSRSVNFLETRQEFARQLHQACRDYGFFYLNLDGFVNNQETDELLRLARQFFQQPQETKDRISLSLSDKARGYARLNENVTNGKADAHEAIDFYEPVPHPDIAKPLHGENLWPEGILGFREKYEIWIQKMQDLGLIVMEAMSTGLGMSSEEWLELRGQVERSFWVMRVIGYPPLPTTHDGFSCGAHKDYGCLTFLYADPTPSALQVYVEDETLLPSSVSRKSEDGKSGVWIDADPIPGCVVCNIGEMWEIWTRGLYKSTLHRVIHRGTNYRVSIPFFFEPNFDAFIQPLAAINRLLSSEDRDKLEKEGATIRHDVVYGDFLMRKVAGNFSGGEKGKYD